MSAPIPPPALFDGRVPDGGHAFLRLLACLATAGGILALTALVSTGSEREAGRLTLAAEQGQGQAQGSAYLATLATAFAASHGRPHRR